MTADLFQAKTNAAAFGYQQRKKNSHYKMWKKVLKVNTRWQVEKFLLERSEFIKEKRNES